MKTFKDLEFKPHNLKFPRHKRAYMEFNNGHWVSVIFGDLFYSSMEKNTYEVYLSEKKGKNPMGYQSSKQVTRLMKTLQQKKGKLYA